MFGHNEKVGSAYFTQADAVDRLLIVSNFFTLQGEGPYRGKRCVFQRLAKCNLACSFCDTWFDSGTWVGYEELLRMGVEAFELQMGDKHTTMGPLDCGLVITGGEPSLQPNLVPYLWMAINRFKWVQIESNGIKVLEDMPATVTLVVSPKCAEKDGVATQYLKPNPQMLGRADVLKFVMSSDQNSPYSEVPVWAHQWARETGKEVFVSPMNIYNEKPVRTKEMSIEERSRVDEVVDFWNPGLMNLAACEANHKHAARYAMKHNFTFQVQEHLFAGLA